MAYGRVDLVTPSAHNSDRFIGLAFSCHCMSELAYGRSDACSVADDVWQACLVAILVIPGIFSLCDELSAF